ncbi:hypothetical protein ABTW24_08880 [Sphingobacterium thalpophilum]|uniref:Uncharacterized protein n=1 Tax=Sphingobacterium thalpophilum TaxID=259 RepID=A0ABV4HB40_9SPHI|nr:MULTISPECIES: hypothetical protein [Sphingobacterium]MCW8313886.1 hypothetical protein [Sphingobacterium sp. InxBP1]
MSSHIYDPKALLLTLIDTEKHLTLEIEKHFSSEGISIAEDIDLAFENFFQSHDLKGNEVGYLSSQLALYQLKREVKKAIEVVVDSNQLRAYYDFIRFRETEGKGPKAVEQGLSSGLLIFGGIIAGILLTIAALSLII